ncbi:ABC transporter permease [Methylobacillus arboreus]|uniref:ABC transporter permease n=1 Tax=Methylobacillus arboreus TaxID=755170 RepID=UPI001E445874|nr:ABC transporter permease [Methylobacillus arboreus]MCB5190776.1 ABC transporter permease [Methylobacillus arboreus]
MKYLLVLAARSAWNRKLTLGLTVMAVALSVTLLLGVERLREQAHKGFSLSVSGTDLIVGARTSPVQLMLYAVFRVGEATNNISWSSYEKLAQQPLVAWSVPISLGDSHHGFPVLGTNQDYFKHYHYGDNLALRFAAGRPFSSTFDTVLGAEVAERLGYKLGSRITLSHGMGLGGLPEHKDKPFVVTGILKPTGTPVDRTVHVSLEAISAIHLDWAGGIQPPGFHIPQEYVRKFDLQPKEITAALIGLKSRAAVFRVQRAVNENKDEALLAVMPGVALEQLWQVVGVAEKSLLAVSVIVVVVSLSGLVAVIMAGLNERRRELAILRSVGAQPREILMLLTYEGVFVTLAGIVIGLALLSGVTIGAAPIMQEKFGVAMTMSLPSIGEFKLMGAVMLIGLLASLLPAYRAYRLSLADGLTPRV